jgi:glycosyltransferase involved in cell wall biosynthesis
VKYLRTLVTSAAYLLQLVRRLPRADVVHIFSASYWSFILAPTPALVLARLLRTPAILNYHSGEAQDHLERWGRTAIPTLRTATRLVVPSEYLRSVFAGFGLKAEVIPNSMELEGFPYRRRERLRPIFLSNRNFESHYGVDRVLRAFAAIQERVPDARLLLVGSGSQEAPLRRLARELGSSGVEFLGPVDPSDMKRIYSEADVFLNASEIDNMPLSVLEAQACGLPVVTSDAGALPQMVRDGETGLLIRGLDPKQLAQQALRLLDDAQLAGRLSEKGRECVESRFTMERVLPEWLKLYGELSQGREPR